MLIRLTVFFFVFFVVSELIGSSKASGFFIAFQQSLGRFDRRFFADLFDAIITNYIIDPQSHNAATYYFCNNRLHARKLYKLCELNIIDDVG